MDIMYSQKVWIYIKKEYKIYYLEKTKYIRDIYQGDFRYNISENSIDIIYKTDDIFMDFDWISLA